MALKRAVLVAAECKFICSRATENQRQDLRLRLANRYQCFRQLSIAHRHRHRQLGYYICSGY